MVKWVAQHGRKPKKVTDELTEYMGDLFKNIQTRTGSHSFNNRMNYVDLGAKKVGSKGAVGLAFEMIFLGGDPIKGDEIGDKVSAVIPPLLPQGAPEAAALDMDECPGKKVKAYKCLCF